MAADVAWKPLIFVISFDAERCARAGRRPRQLMRETSRRFATDAAANGALALMGRGTESIYSQTTINMVASFTEPSSSTSSSLDNKRAH
jgi:hypothetical protein